MGESQVGKTSIIKRYVDNKFDEDEQRSQQVQFYEKSYNIENVKPPKTV